MGRIRASGKTSEGTPIQFVTGESICVSNSIAPEVRNIPIATTMATR